MVNEDLQIPTSLPRNETENPALDNLGRGFHPGARETKAFGGPRACLGGTAHIAEQFACFHNVHQRSVLGHALGPSQLRLTGC